MCSHPKSSSSAAIVTHNLVKEYGSRQVLTGLNLEVPVGGIHALLGPNGSGKTTTLRVLLGLTHATSGTVHILGEPIPRRLPAVIDRVGAVIESPAFHPAFTARRNLQILATAIGAHTGAVDSAMERFGLTHHAQQAVRTLSLGQRQRLAMAAAAMKKPEIFIFDEPTNGLDPESIIELRTLLRELRDDGATILLSTHLLAEVEQLADTVTIIDDGHLVAHGTLAEVTRAATPGVRVGVSDPQRAARILSQHEFDVECGDEHLDVQGPIDRAAAARITALLAREGLYLYELSTTGSLEASFLELVGERR